MPGDPPAPEEPRRTPRPTARPRRSIVSPARVWTLAHNTFTGLVRMKVFYFLLIFSGAVIAAALVFLGWSQEQELKLIKDVSFAAMWVFADLFAIAATALLIPRDLEDRTLYTILAKPVSRFEYLAGKLLGVIVLIGVSLVLMQVVFSAVLAYRTSAVLESRLAQIELAPPLGFDTPEDIAELKEETRREISSQGLRWQLLNGTLSIFLKACVLASFALLLSTFASSTLFTIISGVAVYIIGNFQGLARDFFLDGQLSDGLERVLAFLVAVAFPDFEAFSIIDGIASGESATAIAMLEMTGLAVLYVSIYTLAAFFIFAEKEL